MKNIITLSLLTITCLTGFSQTKSSGNHITPVPISSVKNIGGFFGHRMELNRNNYIKTFPIDEYVQFIEKREHTGWGWQQAEQHGKWVESALLSSIQSEDKALSTKVDEMLNRIIRSQEADGYVGATAKSYRSPERPLRGMDAYELYFVIHAFITAYEETANQDALASAEKLCDYIIRYIGPGKAEFWPSDLRYPDNVHKVVAGQSLLAGHSVHYSWEGTLLIDPFLRLYEITNKKEYLDWSKWVVQNIDKWSGWNAFSKLDSVADGTMGVHQLQPYVHSHTFHMNFMGFLRLYRTTGDESLLRKVTGAWNDISLRQMYITGGVSVAEHYEHGFVKPLSGDIVETCATMSWMQLTQFLLELTGDVKYADAMERLMLNHVFAAQSCDGDGLRYHTAPNGTKPAGYFRRPDCCTASGHRIISLLPTFLYAEGDNGLYVNQYLDSEYAGKDFRFKVETQYPETENISIKISSAVSTKQKLHLRLPQWCNRPQVKLNGKKISNLHSGTYLTLSQKWKKGDVIEITFPMDLKWVKREHHSDYSYTNLPGGEHMYSELPTDRIPYAWMRGPVIYALDMVWNDNIADKAIQTSTDVLIYTDKTPVITSKPDNDMLGPIYQTVATCKNQEVTILLTPFANTGQWYRDKNNQPDKWKGIYSYAIWLYDIPHHGKEL